MERWDLTPGENFFLNVNRFFGFLRQKGYLGKEFELGSDREGVMFVSFFKSSKSQYVTIFKREDGYLDLIIRKNHLFAKNMSYIETKKIKHTGVSYFSKIIQADKEIMNLL